MSSSLSPEVGPVTIRPLVPDDFAGIAELLTQRDQLPWDIDSVRWFLQSLEPDRCRAWGALDGDKLVGLTSFFLRTLERQDTPHRAAYWANLYIDPRYRAQMLYPRLPMTMLRALPEAGAEFLYAAVRLQDVAKAHLSMGFGQVGSQHVYVRFLRPGRFIAKYKSLPGFVKLAAAPLDAAYGLGVLLRGKLAARGHVEEVAVVNAPLSQMAVMLNNVERERFSQVWDADLIAKRYERTREGGEYRVLVSRQQGSDLVDAALVYRDAERGAGIKVAVMMDLLFAEGKETAAVAVLHQLESLARRTGCEALLCFDGRGEPFRKLITSCGFRSSPEKYTYMVYPKKALAQQPWLADAANWNYTFGDHDAF